MSLHGTCVALVDDDALFRDALASLLEMAGLTVEQYDSGEEFLAAAVMETKAACIVTDFDLYTMTGMDLVRQLRQVGFDRPAVLMTGSVDPAVDEQAEELGCVAVLRKPFRRHALMAAIRAALTPVDQGQASTAPSVEERGCLGA